MKYIILCLLLVGCQIGTENHVIHDIDHYMKNMQWQEQYVVQEYYNDSGFSGIDSKFMDIDYRVVNEVADTDSEFALTASMIKDRLWQMNFVDGKVVVRGIDCFLSQQWGMYTGMVCFKDDDIVKFHEITTKGNHQRIELIWTVVGSDLDEFDSVCGRDPAYCGLFAAALEEDGSFCESLNVTKNYCIQIAAQGNVGSDCITDEECRTPFEFLIQSNCPFGAVCIDGQCKVVCSDVGLDFTRKCELDDDCDCSVRVNSLDCICHDGGCLSVEAE